MPLCLFTHVLWPMIDYIHTRLGTHFRGNPSQSLQALRRLELDPRKRDLPASVCAGRPTVAV
jgi:hypothetical protein